MIKIGYIWIVIVLFQVAKIGGQQFFDGPCPNPPPFPNLNRTQYAGVWFLIQKYQSVAGQLLSCALVEYFPPASDGTWNGIQNLTERVSGEVISLPATVSFLSKDGSGYLNADNFFTFSTLPLGPPPQPWDLAFTLRYPYWVLNTDYTNYTVEWTCKNMGAVNFQFMWVFSRTTDLSAETLQSIKNQLGALGLDTSQLASYDRTGCRVQNARNTITARNII